MKFAKRVAFFFVLAVAAICSVFDPTVKAVEKPPWLKECVYDSNGNLVWYTCDYTDREEECNVLNC